MTNARNIIIRTSAGSGKTWRLGNRFLDCLLQAESIDEGLNSILASTFTCKAAGEISDRIFTKFADIALDPEKREELLEYIAYP